MGGTDHYFHTDCPSVRPKTSNSSDNKLPAGFVGWASGSLMTHDLKYEEEQIIDNLQMG